MYGAILDKGEEYYTYLYKIFNGINNVQKDYNWLITDVVAYPDMKNHQELFSKDYCWLSGDEFTHIIEEEDFQWIWGILSGFEKNIDTKEILKYNLSITDNYKMSSKSLVSLQHPLSSMEIMAWDSSLSLIISKNRKIISDFRSKFPLSQDLEIYNKNEDKLI